MTLDTAALDAIEAAAKAATPGPWVNPPGWEHHVYAGEVIQARPGQLRMQSGCVELFEIEPENYDDGSEPQPDEDELDDRAAADCAFIALANPSTVAALVAEVRESRAEREHLDHLEKAAGILTEWAAFAGFDGAGAPDKITKYARECRIDKWLEAEKARRAKRDET